MSNFLLFFFVCQLSFCSCSLHFRWWVEHPTRRAQMEKVINNCCPRDETNTAHFCCAAYLFDANPDKHWKQCQEDGISMATILRTVRCAQREFVAGHAASTDICRLFCCDWLKNVQGATKETDCSTNCTRAAFTVGMSAKQQVRTLKRMGCEREAPLKFNAFEDCLLKKSEQIVEEDTDDDDNIKAADSLVREVCRGENGEK
uniref:DB domain-containing protein n=1 Tax=Globodera pallida TaxID=36090 RepID=A0A183C3M8_GLOPA